LPAALLLAAAPGAHAGILGDEVWCELHYPELGTVLRGLRVYDVVETGPGDAFGVQWNAGATLDPEDDRLVIRALGGFNFDSGVAFNGFVLGDLDFAPGDVLLGLSLEDNTIAGFDGTKFGFLSDDTVWVNFAGTVVEPGDVATLRFVLTRPIPEPAQAVTLVALGVLAFAVCRRWRG
jgi:hypothetical protein